MVSTPIHVFLEFFLTVLWTTFFPSHLLLSQVKIIETIECFERGMNHIVTTIISPRKEYWPSRGTNQRPPVRKSSGLPTDLWCSAMHVCTCSFVGGLNTVTLVIVKKWSTNTNAIIFLMFMKSFFMDRNLHFELPQKKFSLIDKSSYFYLNSYFLSSCVNPYHTTKPSTSKLKAFGLIDLILFLKGRTHSWKGENAGYSLKLFQI